MTEAEDRRIGNVSEYSNYLLFDKGNVGRITPLRAAEPLRPDLGKSAQEVAHLLPVAQVVFRMCAAYPDFHGMGFRREHPEYILVGPVVAHRQNEIERRFCEQHRDRAALVDSRIPDFDDLVSLHDLNVDVGGERRQITPQSPRQNLPLFGVCPPEMPG